MLLTGVFRESSLHVVWFAFAWAICKHDVPAPRRLTWASVYFVVFVVEYFTIRMAYPGHGSITLNPYQILFGRGLSRTGVLE